MLPSSEVCVFFFVQVLVALFSAQVVREECVEECHCKCNCTCFRLLVLPGWMRRERVEIGVDMNDYIVVDDSDEHYWFIATEDSDLDQYARR